MAVTGYRVERCQGAGCTNFAQVGTPTGTSFSDTGLAGGDELHAIGCARPTRPATSAAIRTSATATTPAAPDTTPPTAPTGLTRDGGERSQINLSWTAATDNVAVTGYRVERCQGAGCTNFAQVGDADGAPASATPAWRPRTSYSYRVRAADASGNLGGYSNVATATTPAAPPPPTGLVAAYGFNEGAGTTVADASGNGNTGTISGATWSDAGTLRGALSFNGASSLVRVPSSASLNVSTAMTLEAWIQPTAAQSGWRTIMQREVDAYFLNASNGNGPLRPSGGGTFGGADRSASAARRRAR